MNSMKHIHFPPPVADDMVRALLADRKSVIWRVVKPQPVWSGCGMRWTWKNIGWWYEGWNPIETITWKHTPYRPGDIMYVRETWAPYSPRICKKMIYKNVLYKADFYSNSSLIEWHPSIHMPREVARIFLRVTGVRVERLQEITDEEIVAEGLTIGCYFDEIWDSTIKKKDRARYGWEANPWCWVIAFERISREEAMKSGS